jgi:hypothetical protein
MKKTTEEFIRTGVAPKETRVQITRPIMGLYMQVCAVNDAKDKEILDVCNRLNPSGTERGWTGIVRNDKMHPQCNPKPCLSYPKTRTHYMVGC